MPPTSRKSRWRWPLRLALAAGLAWGGAELYGVYRFMHIACGYAAKVAASCVFIGDRDLESVQLNELDRFGQIDISVDPQRGEVVASAFGVISRRAVLRARHGCVLSEDASGVPGPMAPVEPNRPDRAWPLGSGVELQPAARWAETLDWAFSEPDQERYRRSRAVVIAHRGRIVAERYAEGFGPHTRQHGWSMAKSVTNALIGVLARTGHLDVSDAAPLNQWADSTSARSLLTVDQLLRMSSGLAFEEAYTDPFADALIMLFDSDDMSAYAASRPLEAPPDVEWNYSSGTSVILSGIIHDVVGSERNATFAHDALFDRIGMTSAVFETDGVGTMVGSSMVWASARDWARFGQLFLQDGVWDGRRVLPEGWAEYSRTPTPKSPDGRYGAQWWTNGGDADGRRLWSDLPEDMFWASGFQGQFVVVIPSRDVVIVRLGQSKDSGAFPMNQLTRRVLDNL